MTANGWNGWGPAARLRGHHRQHEPVLSRATTRWPTRCMPTTTASARCRLRRYYVADRDRNKLRSLARLAGDRRAVVRSGPGSHQRPLPDSTYGLQNTKGWPEPRWHLYRQRRLQRDRVLHLRGSARRHRRATLTRPTAIRRDHQRPTRRCGTVRQHLRRLHDAAGAQQQQQAGSRA